MQTDKQLIEATPNYSRRTFTLRFKDDKGRTVKKYRTYSYNREDFESMEFNTLSDWNDFLKSDEYYVI
jgi:hypothetical protein